MEKNNGIIQLNRKIYFIYFSRLLLKNKTRRVVCLTYHIFLLITMVVWFNITSACWKGNWKQS